MKPVLIMLIFLLTIITSVGQANTDGSVKSERDTCFYTIHFPNDMDKPSTRHFDTTLIRDSYCRMHIINLPSCGTEADYSLYKEISMDSKNTLNSKPRPIRSVRVLAGQTGEMDITGLPNGVYTMSLTADCNGGLFTVRITNMAEALKASNIAIKSMPDSVIVKQMERLLDGYWMDSTGNFPFVYSVKSGEGIETGKIRSDAEFSTLVYKDGHVYLKWMYVLREPTFQKIVSIDNKSLVLENGDGTQRKYKHKKQPKIKSHKA